jgi:diguanylate cyclase (GGDEF)-like protein
MSVLFVDIDNFKTINDALGHAAGDELLVTVAQRMSGALRTAEIVCRFGGDEFVVLVNPHSSEAASHLIASRIHEVLGTPFEIDGRLISVTTSIGIASSHNRNIDDLIRDADIAMYQAKAAGKNQTATFDPQMQILASDRFQLEIDLRNAIENQEFAVLYQPMIDLRDHTMVGMEALVRWDHPTRGRLEPIDFIPFAENVGMIVDIDRFVLREACKCAIGLRLGERRLTLAVNVSARQLASERFLDDVRSVLEDTGFDPRCLVLEVTETTIMEVSAPAIDHLHELRRLGVRLAIDDFGTGYSSLSFLRQLPVDILKIDRSFVREMQHSSDAEEIVHSLVELGRKLDLEMVAEGVELKSQLDALEEEHCDTAQGYLFARPLESAQLESFLTEWTDGRGDSLAKSMTGDGVIHETS